MIIDFPTYLERNINVGLEALKTGKIHNFRWFSLLMHLILFHARYYFAKFMDLKFKRDGVPLLVKLWTTFLSSNWEGENVVLLSCPNLQD